MVGVVGNGIANAINNKPFFENAGKAALIGAGVGALVGITCGAIAAAGGVSSALASAGAAIKTAAVTVGAAIKTAAAAVTTAAVTAGTYIASQGQRFIEGARNFVQRAGQAISNVSTKVSDVVQKAKDVVSNVFSSGKSTGEKLLESVTNPKLANTVKELYRNNATIGNGGTADAIRHELSTGELVGGVSHIQKGIERIANIENIIRTQNLNPVDLRIAESLLNDLKDALGK